MRENLIRTSPHEQTDAVAYLQREALQGVDLLGSERDRALNAAVRTYSWTSWANSHIGCTSSDLDLQLIVDLGRNNRQVLFRI